MWPDSIVERRHCSVYRMQVYSVQALRTVSKLYAKNVLMKICNLVGGTSGGVIVKSAYICANLDARCMLNHSIHANVFSLACTNLF